MLVQVKTLWQTIPLIRRIGMSVLIGICIAVAYLMIHSNLLNLFYNVENGFEEEIIDPFRQVQKGDINTVSGLIAELTQVIERSPANPKNYLLLAELYNKTGYYNLSVEHLKKAFSLAKTQEDKIKTLNMLAVCYFYTGDKEQAEKTLKKALKIKRKSYLSQNLAILFTLENRHQDAVALLERQLGTGVKNLGNVELLSRLYLDQAEFTKNIRLLEPILQGQKSYTDLLYNVGISYFKQKDLAKAEKYFTESARQNSKDVDSNYYIGLIEMVQRNYSTAIEKFLLSVEHAPLYKKALPYKALGKLYYEIGDINKAIKYFILSIESNPASPEAYYYLGNLYFENGKPDFAVKNLELAVKYNFETYKTKPVLAYAYYDLKKYKEASTLITELLGENPSHYGLRLYLANCYLKQKRYDLASEEFDELVSIYPQDTNILMNAITANTEAGKYAKAVSLLEKAQEKLPNNPELTYKMAELEYKQGNLEDALKHYESYVAYTKGNTGIYEKMGEIYYRLGNPEESAVYLQKAQESGTTFLPNYYTKIDKLLKAGAYKKAEESCMFLLNAFPDNPEVLGYLAEVFTNSNRENQAVTMLRSILKVNPDKHAVRLKLVKILISHNNVVEGVEHLKYVLQNQQPADLNSYKLITEAYLRLNNNDLARFYAEEGLTKFKNNDALLYNLALTEDHSGNTEKAVGLYRHILAINPKTSFKENIIASLQRIDQKNMQRQQAVQNVITSHTRVISLNDGKGYLSQGDYVRAEQVFKALIPLQPNNREVYFNLAEALKKQGKNAEANQYFDKYIELSLGKKDR